MKTYKELQENIDTIVESGGGEVVNGGAARSARDASPASPWSR